MDSLIKLLLWIGAWMSFFVGVVLAILGIFMLAGSMDITISIKTASTVMSLTKITPALGFLFVCGACALAVPLFAGFMTSTTEG